MKQIHFICGLPRSGSTLLANILAQNPKIYSTPTSGCHDVLFGIKNNWGKLIEHRASKDLACDESLKNVLNASLQAYHNTDKPIVIDKGRGWTSMMEMVRFMGIEPKVLVPVRDINQILSSLEKLHREKVAKGEQDGDYIAGQTVQGRVQQNLMNSSVLGLAYDRLKDVVHRGFVNNLHFVEFEDLTNNPKKKIKEIYEFLGIEPFQHDFNNVEQVTTEDDSVHGGLNLHKIRKKVLPIKDDSKEILGVDITEKYKNTEFWRNL